MNLIELTDFSAPELDVYARLTEAQLLNRHNLKEGLFIALQICIGTAAQSAPGQFLKTEFDAVFAVDFHIFHLDFGR